MIGAVIAAVKMNWRNADDGRIEPVSKAAEVHEQIVKKHKQPIGSDIMNVENRRLTMYNLIKRRKGVQSIQGKNL